MEQMKKETKKKQIKISKVCRRPRPRSSTRDFPKKVTMEEEKEMIRGWFHSALEYADDVFHRLYHPDEYGPQRGPGDSLQKSDVICSDRKTLKDVLGMMWDKIEKRGSWSACGRSFNHIINNGNFASCMGDLLSCTLGLGYSPVAADIESVVIRWIIDLIGYTGNPTGYLVSGGSMAFVTALWVARETRGKQESEICRLVVYLTTKAHFTGDKCLKIVGLKGCILRQVDHNAEQRMIVSDLEMKVQKDKEAGLFPFMVVATAGIGDCGSIDPINEIAKVTDCHGIWLHIDAAFGGIFLLCDNMKKKLQGMERADSVALDPHKGLQQPPGCGTVVFREKPDFTSFTYFDKIPGKAYPRSTCHAGLHEDEEPIGLTFEQDNEIESAYRPFRAFPIWFSLNTYGAETFRNHLKEKLLLAEFACNQLSAYPGLQLGVRPELCSVTFRCSGEEKLETNEQTLKLYYSIEKEKRVYITPTVFSEFTYIQMTITGMRTHLSDIMAFLNIVNDKMSDTLNQDRLKPLWPQQPEDSYLAWWEERYRTIEDTMRSETAPCIIDFIVDNVLNRVHPENVGGQAHFNITIPDQPAPIKDVLAVCLKAFDSTPHKLEYLKQTLPGCIGRFIANVLSMNTCFFKESAGGVELEEHLINWLKDVIKFPSTATGTLCDDPRIAHLHCILTARDTIFKDHLPHSDPVVYVAQSCNMRKVFSVVNLPRCHFREIKANPKGTLDTPDIRQIIASDKKNGFRPVLLISNVQTKDKRSCEDLANLASLVEEYNMWLHIDATHPTCDLMSTLDKTHIKGLSQANSIAVNLQLYFRQPYCVTAFLVRDGAVLKDAVMPYRAVPTGLQRIMKLEDYQPAFYSVELTRPSRALPIWFDFNLSSTK